jgi:NADPH-dependent ferric siderophore reductase
MTYVPATRRAVVVRKTRLSAHLVTVTLRPERFDSTDVPDEYVRLLIVPEGEELVLPTYDEDWVPSLPEGAVEPASRVYTISDHRVVDGAPEVDVDIALHDHGVGSDWVRRCVPGDEVGMMAPHGLYAAPRDVPWQLLVADVTGLPALARILRGLQPGQRVEAVVVLTDEGDRIPLPSPAEVDVRWEVVARDTDVCGALESAVLDRGLPRAGEVGDDVPGGRYVWLAGEARASRAARKHLRRELGWPQADFYTCGYWQIEAERWNARYEEVAAEVDAQARRAYLELAETDQGAYLDAIEEIYEKAGL